ncbi:MAG: FG-GAP-like repeat-containing protein [Nitrospirota bacterium]|nr:FG-GAP-like repeat-containing protein [Nitrospirota bacterium]
MIRRLISIAAFISIMAVGAGSAHAVSITDVQQVVAGDSHTVALKTDGTVWTWGRNDVGQLGDGSNIDKDSPVLVSGLTASAIAAGGDHTVVVKSDGTVWAWGNNNSGQLGDGETTSSSTPVQVSGLTSVAAVAAGDMHSLALKTDGTVWAWGNNYIGQLGNNSTTDSLTPVQVLFLGNVISIAANGSHSVAIKTDGTAWAWGSNVYGELGIADAFGRSIPTQVVNIGNATAAAAGTYHTVFLMADGTIKTSGRNNYGQLGDGTTTDSSSPVSAGLENVSTIAAGSSHTVAVKTDCTVWAWGDNAYGQLGDGTQDNKFTPVQVNDLSDMTAIAAGSGYTVAVKTDGTVWTWGSNGSGQLGYGLPLFTQGPRRVVDISGITAIAAGYYHSVALRGDGTAWTWGANDSCQLGHDFCDGLNEPIKPIPEPVFNFTQVAAIAAGGYHTVAIKADETVWAWGRNSHGQLGAGFISNDSAVPVRVMVDGYDLTAWQIAAGYNHTISRNNGGVYTWGSNDSGQLGDSTLNDSSTPVLLKGLGFATIAAGYYHSVAIGGMIQADETVWAWGSNGVGQLGDGSNIGKTTPVQVTGLTGTVVAVAAGAEHTVAVKSDGTVWAWGGNYYGQLGDGGTINSSRPVQVSGLNNVVAIAAGGYHTVALKVDGTVWAWGRNYYGQLGDGTLVDRFTPVQVNDLSDVTAIAGGFDHTVARKTDGTVWAWGRNDFGQLGLVREPFPRRVNREPVPSVAPIQMRYNTSATTQVIPNDPDPLDTVFSYAILAPPLHGTASVDENGLVTYTPLNYCGRDGLWITVTDADGGTGYAYIFIEIGACMDINVIPNSANFDDVGVGNSISMERVVSNIGGVDLHISAIAVIGPNAGEFGTLPSSTNPCPNAPFTLTPGTNCNILATFAPTSAGAKNATLRITSDDPDTPDFDIPLSGTGVFGAISGTVTSQATGSAISSCSVQVLDGNGSVIGSTTTDGAGSYTVGDLTARSDYSVAVFGDPMYANQLVSGVTVTPPATTTVDIVMVPAGSNEPLGAGSFSAAVPYAAGSGPSSVAVGSLDADGSWDLVAANYNSSDFSLLFSNGTGTFLPPSSYAASTNPRSVATGDFDGDGELDIAAANSGTNTVTVRFNNNGDFTSNKNLNAGSGSARASSVASGNFNGDGYADIAVTDSGNNRVAVFLSNGDTTFQTVNTYNVGAAPLAVTSNDFNGDGKADLAVANSGSDNVSILFGNGNGDGTFPGGPIVSVGTTPYAVATGDFNGDGYADLVVANFDSDDVSVLLNNNGAVPGMFHSAVSYPTGTEPYSVVTGDFNGDGTIDLAVANSFSNTVSVLTGNGDGTFQTAVNYPVGTGPRSVAAGDLNNDGKVDLAVANFNSNNVSILLNSMHRITTSAGPNGFLECAPTMVNDGGSASCSVTPYPGYLIDTVEGCGGSLAGNTYTITNLTTDCGVSASFVQITHQLSVSITGIGSVTSSPAGIDCGGDCSEVYAQGTVVTLTPLPGDVSMAFSGWTGDPDCSDGVVTMDGTTSCTATFTLKSFNVSGITGGNGTISCTSTVNYGESPGCSIVPDSGYHLASLIDNSISVIGLVSNGTYTISNITENHTVEASFAINTYTITASAGSGGGVTPSGSVLVNHGADQAFTITPDTGYHVADVLVDGSSIGVVSAYTFTTVTTDHTISASFAQDDTTPPTLVVSTLSDGATTNNQTLNINGTVTDSGGIQSLVVSGTTVTVQGDNSFSHVVTLVTGSNTITSVATDLAGNTTTDSRTITLDQAAPGLVITMPADNSITNQLVSTITGTVDENASVSVVLNSDSPQLASMAGNSFTATVNLVSGINTIDVTATDLAGNTSTAKRTVTFDNISPSLAITSPGQDTSTNQAAIIVGGTMDDSSGVTVVVTCPTASVKAVSYPTATTWQVDITNLSVGQNTVTATATDQADNAATAVRNIIYDTIAPAVTISPVSSPTNATGQTASGTMEEGATVSVECSTATVAPVSYPTATSWTVEITGLSEGTNSITATAADLAGNSATASAEIVLDTAAPDTTITSSPAVLSNTVSALFNFSADETGSTFVCSIDSGSFINCSSPATYSILAEGGHTFQVKATDQAGNTDNTPATYAWSIDTIAPTATITGAPGSDTNQTSATLTVGGTDVTAYQYKLDSGSYSAEIPVATAIALTGLSDGSHAVSVIGKDSAGNWQSQAASTTATWTVDTAAPGLSLSTLSDGATTNNQTLNIFGTVTDSSGVESLVISGQTVTVQGDSSFSHVVTLVTGNNTIISVATDLAGNTTTDSRTIILDQAAPGLVITMPADNSITNQLVSTITGTVDENASVSVVLNSDSPQLASMAGNSFTVTVNLVSGINTIDITATDLAGNTNTLKRTVTYDSIAPGLAVTMPDQDRIVTSATVTISGTVTDSLTTAMVVITDGTSTYTPAIASGSFTQEVTFPAEGIYAITVTATDEAGNSSTVVRNIIYARLGDLDADGTVSVGDALKILRVVAGLDTATVVEMLRADVAPLVNGQPSPDGRIDISDVLVILRKAVGLW